MHPARLGKDGTLWVGKPERVGIRSGKEFGLQQVKWDGKTTRSPCTTQVDQGGFPHHLTKPTDKALPRPGKIPVERWGYHYHPKYGSPKTDLKRKNHPKSKFPRMASSKHRGNLREKQSLQIEPGSDYG